MSGSGAPASARPGAAGRIIAQLRNPKTLIITGAEVNESFAKAARNVVGVDVLPVQGANVFDILRHKELVLTKDAVSALQERLA